MEQKKRVAGDWLVGKERETHSQPAIISTGEFSTKNISMRYDTNINDIQW